MDDFIFLLRDHVSDYSSLPVGKGEVGVDNLLDKKSMAVQLLEGEIVDEFCDGFIRYRQPFAIYFKDSFKDGTSARADMISQLMNIGKWLESEEMPTFDNMVWEHIKRIGTPNLLTQNPDFIIYMCNYEIVYNYKDGK